MTERYALYYAPATASPLWARAAQWLGRDATGAETPADPIAGVAAARRLQLTASARRYGFHATIKAPMTLAAGTGRQSLESELTKFGLRQHRVCMGRLTPRFIDGFLALVPEAQSAALTAVAAEVVAHFDRFRAPLPPEERDRRLRGGLSAYQIGLLDHFGYPYVMDEFRFHMTLTDRLDDAGRGPVMAAAKDWFGPVLAQDWWFDRLVLFHEPAPGAPFVRLGDYPLSARVAVDA